MNRRLSVIASLILGLAFLFLTVAFLASEFDPVAGAVPAAGSDIFVDSGQSLGDCNSTGVALGDLDGDGDADAFVVNYDAPHAVYLNQGGLQGGMPGHFLASGQQLGNGSGIDISLGDLDNDGDLDAVAILDAFGDSNQVWINQGGLQGGAAGVFTTSTQLFGDDLSGAGALGHLDGDSNLDLFVTRGFGRIDKVWLGAGNGLFSDSAQPLSSGSGTDLALADVDGDDDLDAFLAMSGDNALWINQGGTQAGAAGQFLDSEQILTSTLSLAVAMGDLDGDDDMDAFVANSLADKLWINQGGSQGGTAGIFKDSGQSLSSGPGQSRDVALGDVDDDGDLDAVLGKPTANELWINQGGAQLGENGVFSDSGQRLGNSSTEGIALADLDGDGDLDAFAANGNGPNKVWLNESIRGEYLGQFIDSGQRLVTGYPSSDSAQLADLDGDGDLDLVIADENDRIGLWKNNAAAIFSRHSSYPYEPAKNGLAIGDIDNDLIPDVVLAGITETLINDGDGNLQPAAALPDDRARNVVMGDLDGDDDLDLVVKYALTFTYEYRSWINAGGDQGGTPGQFEDHGVRLGPATYFSELVLGDLDGDGDLDAIASHTDGLAHVAVWFNQGGSQLGTEGDFAYSGHSFGNVIDGAVITALSLGDVDGDGDLDVYLAKKHQPDGVPDELYFNSGGAQGGTPGIFVDAGQDLDIPNSYGSTFGDVDNDGDLDLLVAIGTGFRVWLNNGGRQGGVPGAFVDSGQKLAALGALEPLTGDLDDDGDLDALVYGRYRSTVWLNGEPLITPTLTMPYNLINSGGEYVLPWWLLTNARLPIQVTRNLNTTAQLKVWISSGGFPTDQILVFPPGTLTQYPTYKQEQPGGAPGEIWNPYFGTAELGSQETYEVTLDNAEGAIKVAGISDFSLIFHNPDNEIRECFLDGVAYMLSLLNQPMDETIRTAKMIIDSSLNLDLFYQVRDQVMAASPQGHYYRGLYYAFSPELLQITAQNVGLLQEIGQAIDVWTPALQALVDGQGDAVTITPSMIEQAVALLEAYEAEASPELAGVIRREMSVLDLPSFTGLTMDEALVKVNQRPLSHSFLSIATR